MEEIVERDRGRVHAVRSACVYRCWSGVPGEAVELLYVGRSVSEVQRALAHLADEWGERFDFFTIERFPDEESAAVAEAVAIRDEGPLFNRATEAHVLEGAV